MCTLLAGWNVLGPDTLLVAANRDEDPARPADPPRVLHAGLGIVGGRDRVAGGTWLALRGRRMLVAVLNRRGDAVPPHPRRPSRGRLALAVAEAGDGHPAPAAEAARRLLDADDYAACSLVIAGPEGAFLVVRDAGARARLRAIAPGWHALTHAELDDANEPRAAWLAAAMRDFRPGSRDEAEAQLGAWLADHGGTRAAVCLHEGRMVTVSTSRVWLARDGARYRHGEGHACTANLLDYSDLLSPR